MPNDNDLIEFIRSARGPFHIDAAAAELENLGGRPGVAWPRASAQDWKREFQRLVNKGKLTDSDGMLTVTRVESLKQGSLFD